MNRDDRKEENFGNEAEVNNAPDALLQIRPSGDSEWLEESWLPTTYMIPRIASLLLYRY